MRKTKEELVKSTINQQVEMNNLTQDVVSEVGNIEEPPVQNKESYKAMAEKDGVMWIEPSRKLKPIGTLQEKLKRMHAHDWEYVRGIYENDIINGEPIKFWYCKYAGDPDCLWEVPANRPICVPRMIAKHLSGEKDELNGSQSMVYHTFDHVKTPEAEWDKDRFTHRFSATGTRYRGKFRAIGAFA